MDEWEDFPGIGRAIVTAERLLVESRDLVVASSQRIFDKWNGGRRPTLLARNAVDFDYFQQCCIPNDIMSAADRVKPVIGYYGAIAEWFDVQLMVEVARARPQYDFVLLGGVFGVNVDELASLPNVRLKGQRPYAEMPLYLYHFDVCLIPFKVSPITCATDPVKLYEYLSGGKPVVAVDLPELAPYKNLVYLARNKQQFLQCLDAAVSEKDASVVARRRETAAANTWAARCRDVVAAVAATVPRASIIVVTYNNLRLTQLCLASILRNTQHPNYEIVVVDNGSTDGTPQYLRKMEKLDPRIRVVLNGRNEGFAAANNIGIRASTGRHLVLLNNDTVVPPGWLSRLLRYLDHAGVGLVGPVTNFAGNEAKIEVSYRNWQQMEIFAARQATIADEQVADIHMLAMFCVALRRELYDQVGPLDEEFGVGMFEDDDYAIRVKSHGLRVICAADVFVHHFGQASFKQLIADGQYNRIFERNRRRYESKWNVVWKPRGHARVQFAPIRGRVQMDRLPPVPDTGAKMASTKLSSSSPFSATPHRAPPCRLRSQSRATTSF